MLFIHSNDAQQNLHFCALVSIMLPLLLLLLLLPISTSPSSVTNNVKQQYTALPYPPRNPLDEHTRLISDIASHPGFVDHYLFPSKRTFTAPHDPSAPPLLVLIAGGGTGDVTTFLSETFHLLSPHNYACSHAHIYHLDLSPASISITQERVAIREAMRKDQHPHLEPTNVKITYLQGSLLSLSTPSGRESLGHGGPQRGPVLREIARRR